MRVLNHAVLVDGKLHAAGTEETPDLAAAVPERFWDGQAEPDEPADKPTRRSRKAQESS